MMHHVGAGIYLKEVFVSCCFTYIGKAETFGNYVVRDYLSRNSAIF